MKFKCAANFKHHLSIHCLFLALLFCAVLLIVQEVKGSRIQISLHNNPNDNEISSPSAKDNRKRLLIGSVAPTCTYNECKGCKYKCKAKQVPVEGNDPINSAYHYKCVCNR